MVACDNQKTKECAKIDSLISTILNEIWTDNDKEIEHCRFLDRPSDKAISNHSYKDRHFSTRFSMAIH